MPLISEFEQIRKESGKVHKPVRCGYCSFVGDDQNRDLLLETYGSSDRQMPDKISQSIQLNEAGARQLLEIIRHEFPQLG